MSQKRHNNRRRYYRIPMTEQLSNKGFSETALTIQRQRDQLRKKTLTIRNRLMFCYNAALHDYYLSLLREDLTLCCELNDQLYTEQH